MKERHNEGLAPCPICGKPPERLSGVSRYKLDVIHCPRGCKPHIFGPVVHITSDQLPQDSGWADLGDAWNTIRVEFDDCGQRHVVFDAYAPAHAPAEVWGRYLDWSPAISANQVAIQRARTALAASPTPPAEQQAASSAVLKAIRAANMQLVRTGDDAFMLVPYKVATTESVTPEGGATTEAALGAEQAAPKAAPGEPQNCGRCCGSGEDPAGYYDQSRGDAGATFGGPCRECNGTGAAPQQEAQEPHGWLYEWTHSSATGKPDATYTAFTTDEAHASKHDNCRAIYTAPQPAPAPLSERGAFEAWARSVSLGIERVGNRPYFWQFARWAWEAWQARAALAAQGGKDA